MAIRTATVTINAAFLREIKEDNQRLKQLLHEIRTVLSSQSESERLTRHALMTSLEDLRDQLATHFTLEEAFGYFDEPLSAAPRLSSQAEDLRRQHAPLFVQFCQLVEDTEDAYQSDSHTRAFHLAAYRFHEWDAVFQAHEQAEQDLILEAFNSDIGVGD